MASADGGLIAYIGDLLSDLKNRLWKPDTDMRTLVKRVKGEQRNINRLAKRSILHFPLIVSDSCDFEMAMRLANAIEHRSAVLTKLVIERIGLINLEKGGSKEELISKVRGFERLSDADEEWLEVPELRSLVEGKTGFDLSGDEGGLRYSLLGESEPAPEAWINRRWDASILQHAIKARPEGESVESALQRLQNSQKSEVDRAVRKGWSKRAAVHQHNVDVIEQYFETTLQRQKARNESLQRQKAGGEAAAEQLKQRVKAQAEEDRVQKEHKRRVESDLGSSWATVVKKMNRSEPLKIEVEVEYATPGFIKSSKFTLGVKSVAHVVPSGEIIRFLPKAKFDMSVLIKLARLWTGEIKFWRDFVLNLTEVKDSFRRDRAGKDAWYAKLKRLTSDNNLRRLAGGDLMPTATLAVSMEDVEEMLRQTDGRFDLSSNGMAREIVKSLSLLNLVIIDEANERVWWYDEADGEYDVKTAEVLQKEDREITQNDLLKTIIAVTK